MAVGLAGFRNISNFHDNEIAAQEHLGQDSTVLQRTLGHYKTTDLTPTAFSTMYQANIDVKCKDGKRPEREA